jgi:hypothetical protein
MSVCLIEVKFSDHATIVVLKSRVRQCAEVCFKTCSCKVCSDQKLRRGLNEIRGPPGAKQLTVRTECETLCFDLKPCRSGPQRVNFNITSPNWFGSGFIPNGDAQVSEPALELGPSFSSAWFNQTLSQADFISRFVFTLPNQSNNINNQDHGFTIALQNAGTSALGNSFGYSDIPGPSIAFVVQPNVDHANVFALRDGNTLPITPPGVVQIPLSITHTYTGWLRYDFCKQEFCLFVAQGIQTELPAQPVLCVKYNLCCIRNPFFGFATNNICMIVWECFLRGAL